ncbi:MAG: Ig domain-containing protein, partial [Candidatus Acidiferrales bacterium]
MKKINRLGVVCLFLLAVIAIATAGHARITSGAPTTGPAAGELSADIRVQIIGSALPSVAVGVNYKADLAAANGVPPYTWGIVSGELPPGLSLQASTGQISGMPTQAGAFTFLAQVRDSAGGTASSNFSINAGTSSAPSVSGASPVYGRGFTSTG